MIEKKGSWFSFKGEQLGQWREKALIAAKEKDGMYDEIVRLTREKIKEKMGALGGDMSSSSSSSSSNNGSGD